MISIRQNYFFLSCILSLSLLGSGQLLLADTPPLYPLGDDSKPQPGVPAGEMIGFQLTSKTVFPGAAGNISIYVPAEYTPDKPACLCVGLDGAGNHVTTVLDNLIFKKQVPVTIGVFIQPGSIADSTKSPIRYDRCYEWDSTNDNLDRFIFGEILPAVESRKTKDGRAINISPDPNDHMIYGASSGGVGSFTAAWQHPDEFRRVFTAIGTYVGMRGADMYPTLIRKTEPKPIRIYLQDGAADTWNPLFDNWFTQNKSMEESLTFAGYDVTHTWGVLGHNTSQADSIFPDVMRWLWRDYPAPIVAGVSGNSMFKSVLVKDQTWSPVATPAVPGALAADAQGVLSFAAANGDIYRGKPDGTSALFAHTGAPIAALAFAKDGTLFAAQPSTGKLVALSPAGAIKVVAQGLKIGGLTLANDGTIYATEPGDHDDEPSAVWRIGTDGKKTQLDAGLIHATGIVMTPDHELLFVAEGHTHWIYSYVMAPDGTLQDKQRFYWLHVAESSDDLGDWADATDLAEDAKGDLYVATRMGIQICDRNGRVEGILTFPDGQVSDLCFGGPNFTTLYAVCGGKLYQRALAVPGVPDFSDPLKLPTFNAG